MMKICIAAPWLAGCFSLMVQTTRCLLLYTVLPCLVLVFTSVGIYAQPKSILDKTVYADNAERFYAESYVVPGITSDTSNIVVIFRMSNDFLSFTKASLQNATKGSFQATMAVSMEVRDTMGVIRQRVKFNTMVFANTYDETNDKTIFHHGWQTIPVVPGTYAITIELLDQKVGQPRKLKLPVITYNRTAEHSLITAPVFARPVPSKDRLLLLPYVLSGNVGFGTTDAVALLQLEGTTTVAYDYLIRQEPYGLRDIRWWGVEDIEGQVKANTNRRIQLSDFANSKDPFLEVVDQPSAFGISLVEIAVPVTQLVPGNYSLALVAIGTTDTITVPFRIQWETMPMSLRNLDYAIGILKYTVKPEGIDSINTGSDAERRSHLMQWWRDHDATPTTTYNERMTEYYRRVDQAFAAFSTIQEPDGADTERGKVYILYGPPTAMEKRLTPDNAPLEVWTYSNSVRKVFNFSMDPSGLYKVTGIESLPK